MTGLDRRGPDLLAQCCSHVDLEVDVDAAGEDSSSATPLPPSRAPHSTGTSLRHRAGSRSTLSAPQRCSEVVAEPVEAHAATGSDRVSSWPASGLDR